MGRRGSLWGSLLLAWRRGSKEGAVALKRNALIMSHCSVPSPAPFPVHLSVCPQFPSSRGEQCPPYFHPLERSLTGFKADLNRSYFGKNIRVGSSRICLHCQD